MSLSDLVAGQVAAQVRGRGREYFLDGLVDLDLVGPTKVQATVHGSEAYDVDLELEGRTLYVGCTCPYVGDFGGPCKHIWATILAAEPAGFGRTAPTGTRIELDSFDSDDDFDEPEPVYRAPVRPAPAAPKPEKWTTQLDALQKAASPDTGSHSHTRPVERQLLYVVDAEPSEQAHKLVVEIQLQEMKKNGQWGKPKAQGLQPAYLETLVDPLDRQLVALLAGPERGDSYYSGYSSYYGYNYGVPRYRLTGPVLDAVLPLIARTGRVWLRRDPKVSDLEPLTEDPGPPWELVLTVRRDAKGKNWVVTGMLRRGAEALPLSKTDLVVPGLVVWDGRFARLAGGEADAWAPALRKKNDITVPIGQGEALLGRLLALPSLPRLELPDELRVTEEAGTPKPRLVVRQKKSDYGYGPPVLVADLSFDYDGETVPAKPPARGFFRAEGRRFVLRDRAGEQAAERELARLGVRPGYARYNEEPKLELKPAALPKLVRELVAQGWKVEAEGKLYRKPGEFKLSVATGQDWFDLSATADFDGRPVPLPTLLAALNRGESTVPLDDGTFGLVPEEWLKKYGLLAQMGTVEGDQIRFARAQVGVLDALLATRPEVTFDKQFARARDELRKFTGIAPADPPPAFKGELREYQREGLGWLRFVRKFGFGGCLADDMGLGKTVQVLALLAGKRTGPALVVVPRSLVFNWKQEAARFAPKLKILDHTGTGRDRTGATFKDYDLVLTTYGTLRNDAAMFADVRFDTCILDESQAAKNAETETAKAVRLLNADHRLALSGTPVENHLGELWTLFDFLNPGMLGRAGLFGAGVRNPDPETREILAKALRPFILRRTKDQVAKDLPAKTEQTVYCDLEPEQRKLYDELREHYRRSLLAKVEAVGLGRAKIQVLEALLRLRQAACHPGLIDPKRAKESSAKLDVLIPQLQETIESGHKVLVFSQFTSLLSIVKDRLKGEAVEYIYLDGRTRDRAALVERFQTDPACRLFLISLKAGGVGLNLTAAEYVFLLDPWWNPAVEAQAIDRSHRIGQTKPVFAYRLIARDTVEEKVLALQQSKRELADAILGGDGRLLADLKREDLELLLS
jgi:superfamily II DNA or RNA helicase